MKMNKAQWGWLLYDPANAAYALIVRTVFAPLFFKYAASSVMDPAMSTSRWGYTASAAGVAAGIIALSLGPLADRLKKKKFFLGITLTLGVASTIGLCFVPPSEWRIILALIFTGLVAYMVSNSLYDALLADVSTRANRHSLSSAAYAWGYIGGIIPFLGCLGLSVLGWKELAVIRGSFVIAGIWWSVLALPLFFTVRERGSGNQEQDGIEWNILPQIWRDRNLRIFLISYFLYIDGVGTIYLMAAPLATDVGVPDTGLIVTVLALQFLAFPFTLLYGAGAKRFSGRLLVLCAIGIYCLIAVLAAGFPLLESPRARLILFIIIAALVGTSQGGIQALSRSLYSKLIPGGKSSAYFGVYNLFGKFTTIAGPLLVGLAVHLWGHSEYGITLLLIPFILGGYGLLLVKFSGEKR